MQISVSAAIISGSIYDFLQTKEAADKQLHKFSKNGHIKIHPPIGIIETIGGIFVLREYRYIKMCKFFEVSRSGYYGYVSRMEKSAKDLHLANKIKECQDKCGKTYGYRRVHLWPKREGIHHDPKTVLRAMRKYDTALHKYPNLPNRDFHAQNLIRSGLLIFHTFT